jgi:hypothetical protein
VKTLWVTQKAVRRGNNLREGFAGRIQNRQNYPCRRLGSPSSAPHLRQMQGENHVPGLWGCLLIGGVSRLMKSPWTTAEQGKQG